MCLLVVPEGGVKQLCGVLRGKHKKTPRWLPNAVFLAGPRSFKGARKKKSLLLSFVFTRVGLRSKGPACAVRLRMEDTPCSRVISTEAP